MILKEEGTAIEDRSVRFRRTLRFFALGLLLSAVVCEACCLFLLRGSFTVRSDELRSLSMQLQYFKNERAELREELSSIKFAAGEEADGNPSFR